MKRSKLIQHLLKSFEIISEITDLEVIAVGNAIRDLARLRQEGNQIIDESDEDYLYPAAYFVMIDLSREAVRALNKAYERGYQRAADA